MEELRRRVIQQILSECFWGDYRLDLPTAEARLDAHDADFERFLAGRIIREGSFPSASLKAIFSLERLKGLLEEIRTEGRAERRRTLARANIFNIPWEHGRSWARS